MAITVSSAIKHALPAPVLALIRAFRWRARVATDRARWLASGRRGRGIGIGRFAGRRIAYRIGSVDTEVLGHSFDHDIFFAAIPEFELKADAIVIDVGAHIGTFSVLAAEKAVAGRVFAIEPSRDTCALLRANVELSGMRHVVVDQLALAGANGRIELHHDPDGNYGHSITRNLASTNELVEAATLEHYLDSRNIERVALAKFNCEGAEFPTLLSSTRDTLRRIEKLIVLYHCDLTDVNATVLTAHLRDCGFDLRLANQTATRGWIIATLRPGD